MAATGLAAGLDEFPLSASSVVRADRRTGRLVRTVLAPRTPRTQAGASGEVPEAVRKAAAVRNLDPLLVHSVIQAESDYNPFAVSPKGAQGLMQLMPSTARRYGVTNSFNIAENLEAGVSHLRYLLDLFGDQDLALAAYNAGEGAVIRYRGIPPYPETQQYVRAVSSTYAGARQTSGAQPAPGAEAPPPEEPVSRPIEQFLDAQGNLHILTR